MRAKSTWVGLTEAAKRLSIHPTTLRRWADAGEIPTLLTPGGHRRFALADLEHFAQDRHRLKTIGGLEQVWVEQALTQTRQALAQHQTERWLTSFTEAQREQKRQLGHRLMGLLLRFVALADGGEEQLAQAQALGREHAEHSLQCGLPLVAAMQALMFFRDTLIEAAIHLPETAHLRPEANLHLLRRINTLLNAVQLAVAEVYDQRKE